MTRLIQLRYLLFPLLGVACILFSAQVTAILPYLLGGTMIFTGLLMIFLSVEEGDLFRSLTEEMAYGSTMVIMGIVFVLKGTAALPAVGTTWALIGTVKAAKSLHRTFQRIYYHKSCWASLLEFVVRLTLSILLLFNPLDKIHGHVVLLGLELLFSNIRFAPPLPLPLPPHPGKEADNG